MERGVEIGKINKQFYRFSKADRQDIQKQTKKQTDELQRVIILDSVEVNLGSKQSMTRYHFLRILILNLPSPLSYIYALST